MFDCAAITAALQSDPRLDERYVRCLDGGGGLGSVVLLGVVHDHPASVFRVARLLGTFPPAHLALELPPIAVSLFRLYARDRYMPPRLGGEMSMAIRAAGDVSIVGIDAPNWSYLRRLVARLSSDRTPLPVLRTVLRDLVSGYGHALACRFGALVGAVTPLRPQLYSHIEYDCSLLDSPAVQADHETAHLDQRQAFLRAIEVPHATRIIDETREEYMATRLHELRADGDVVAVIGMEHLDAVASSLLDSS